MKTEDLEFIISTIKGCQNNLKCDTDYLETFHNNTMNCLSLLDNEINNNGWTKIKTVDDLPKEEGLKCLFFNRHGNTTYISDDVLYDPDWFNQKYTHWRIKNEIKDPLD